MHMKEVAASLDVVTLQVLSSMTKSLAHQFAEYACALDFEDLSRDTVHEVKRRIIDSIGCALGAWNEEPCRIARKVASDFSAKNGATIIGTHHQAPPDWAAFATDAAFDTSITTTLIFQRSRRIRAITFPRCWRWRKAWARADAMPSRQLRSPMKCNAACATRPASVPEVGIIRPMASFSTALAAAKLMKLDPEKTRHAINIAGVAGMGHATVARG